MVILLILKVKGRFFECLGAFGVPVVLARISHQVLWRGGVDGHGYKARDGKTPQAYSTVRRGVRPNARLSTMNLAVGIGMLEDGR
jgi:hypothetical protein